MKKDENLEQKFQKSYSGWESAYADYKNYIKATREVDAEKLSLHFRTLHYNIISSVMNFFELPDHLKEKHNDKLISLSEGVCLLREHILCYIKGSDVEKFKFSAALKRVIEGWKEDEAKNIM